MNGLADQGHADCLRQQAEHVAGHVLPVVKMLGSQKQRNQIQRQLQHADHIGGEEHIVAFHGDDLLHRIVFFHQPGGIRLAQMPADEIRNAGGHEDAAQIDRQGTAGGEQMAGGQLDDRQREEYGQRLQGVKALEDQPGQEFVLRRIAQKIRPAHLMAADRNIEND